MDLKLHLYADIQSSGYCLLLYSERNRVRTYPSATSCHVLVTLSDSGPMLNKTLRECALDAPA
jgi:hypothetical protein